MTLCCCVSGSQEVFLDCISVEDEGTTIIQIKTPGIACQTTQCCFHLGIPDLNPQHYLCENFKSIKWFNAARFSLLVQGQLSFHYRLLFFDAEYRDDPGAENANASQSEDTSSLEHFLTLTDQQVQLQELRQPETLLELSMDTVPIQPTAVATTTLTTDQKCIYRIWFIIFTFNMY